MMNEIEAIQLLETGWEAGYHNVEDPYWKDIKWWTYVYYWNNGQKPKKLSSALRM